nr:MAG TPA: Neck appendage protein [Caudoviricetes sp.]
MIIRLNSEANLVKATEVKLIKTSDYQDTLTFKLPLDEQIFVDEIIRVRTKVMKQDYRVKEIITKDRFKDVYCEHKFFDCKNIIIPFIDEAHRAGESYNDFSRYNSLQSIVAHLNRIMRTKGDTEFKFSTDIDKSGVVECDDTPLFDLIFGEKGILKTFNVELVYDNYKVKFVEKRPSKNTEILFHENKNVSELQETVDFKGIITKLHVTCKYTPDKTEEGKAERERLRAEKRRELFNKSQEKIKAREARQAQERALRRQKQEEAYQASRTAPKKTREQIHAEHLQKQQDTENRILANNAARRQAREQKFNEREQQRVSRAQDKDDLIFRTVFVSPLVNRYARPYEASLNFQSSEINSEAALIAWCNANLFTDEDTRDVPLRNFSFKPVEDDYNVDINDRAMVNFTSIGTTKIVHCCKIEYDALHDKYLNIEFGVLNKSAIRETIGNLNSKISETNSTISRTYDILDKNFDDYVQKELEAYSELFYIDRGEIDEAINHGFEDAKIEAEKVYGNINTDIENKLAPIREEVRTTVEAYNQQFITTRETLDRNKAEADRQIRELNKNKVETEKQFRELNQRVTGMQDISSNSTVVELKKLVNEAKETGKNINQKVTELEGNVTREFSSVKAKNENDLKVIRGEIKTGVDGLTSKINSLEQYKNQDGSRTESLKQWVQRDTANQLSRERTEITRIVDAKGYVKNAEFSNKFNENAQGINRKIEALETYKNQDGTRISSLKQWTQENTASQLSTARRGIENWVDGKGYATTSVVENKVQETANSISREIRNIRENIPTSVGGRNYITDSDKLNAKPHWGSGKWDETVDGDTIILTKKGGSDNTGFWFTLTDLVKTQFQNETLTWSIDVKASRDMTLNTVGFETNGKKQVNITTNWTRISHTFINKFTNYYAFVFYHPTTNFNNGDKIYIRLPKLEKGNVATDWTPAPEDNNAFVKNTEFSNKFNENAQGINRQLTALEQYKNQEGVRTNSLKQWTQENTASQLNSTRQGIERWVDSKGYATTSVVNNKVQEATNSFSREISNVRNSIPTNIGGRNYIPNSNFAKELENWEMARLNNSGLNWQKGHAIYHFGRGLHIWGTPNGEYKGLGTIPFSLTAKQGEKITVSMDLGKDALTAHSILFIGLHYIVDNDMVSQQWQTLDLATQNFEVKKYKRISKTFTVTADINKCRLMIHTKANQLINFYIDNIKLEKGNVATDWTPAPEDSQQSINELNSWKQTTTQTLNTVSSTLNDTVRHSQLQITADSINFGSNKVFNGRNLASMLSVSPDSIKAITDKLVITPTNENLVLPEHRDTFILDVRNGVLNKIYGSNTDLEGEYYFKLAILGWDTPTLYASIRVTYIDETEEWFNSEFPTPNTRDFETSTSVKVQVKSTKKIKYIEPLVYQNKWSDFYRFHLKKLFVGKKKSAELIVDGTIEGKHIKSSTIETGHLKAGSVTANIVAADAIESKHMKVDDAMIEKLVANKAFVTKLWAKEAFINNLESVKIKSTQIDTESLRGKTITGATINGGEITGEVKIKLGAYGFMQPTSEGGLQINSPRRFNSKDGIGVQIIGATERGDDIPYGLFVYQDRDFTVGDRAVDTDSYIVTVQGFIRTKGINNLRFVNYRDASTSIGLWNKDVSLLFDNTDNDIYYSWKSKYSLWNIIKQHYNTTSDVRLKKDIKKCDYKALDLIDDFNFKSFNWEYHEEFGQKPYTEIGLIAQDVEKINKNFVAMAGEYKTLNQFNLLTYSLKAIQELSTQNKELQNRISKLEGEING